MRFQKHIVIGLATACLLANFTIPASAKQAPPAKGDEAAMIAILQSKAPLFNKAKACQRLASIGTKTAVPVLAKLLPDARLSHYARFALEPIPDSSVDDALRASLHQVQGGLLVGVINSIGMRRDAQAVTGLSKLLGNADRDVVAAAAAALARIATPAAIDTLKKAFDDRSVDRTALADPLLTAAMILATNGKRTQALAIYDRLRRSALPEYVKMAALQATIRARGPAGLPLLADCLRSKDKARFRVALRMAQELPGDDVTRALVDEFPRLRPSVEATARALTITKAEYGARDKWIDVTKQIANAVDNNTLAIRAGNDLAGDPIHGVVKQLRITYTLGGQPRTASVDEGGLLEIGCDKSRDMRQALLVYALGARGDKGALPVILQAARSGAEQVRLPAVRVLATLGDVSAIPVLLETAVAAQGALAQAARDSLAKLPGARIDAALAAKLAQSQGRQRLVLIDLVGRRRVASTMPTLLKLADSDDRQLRTAAIGALGLTVDLDQLPALVARFVQPGTADVAVATKEALRKACQRMPDRDACAAVLVKPMAQAPAAAKAGLLDLLGVVGGPKALAAVSAAAMDNDERVQDAATRVLGRWMSPAAAPILLTLARADNGKFKVRTLRGYIRIARQLDVPAAQRIAMCREALSVANRDAEKKLAIETLARCPSPASLALVVPYLENPGLKEAASAAAVSIAKKIVDAHPAVVATAMKKTIRVTRNAELAGSAKRLLGRAKAKSR